MTVTNLWPLKKIPFKVESWLSGRTGGPIRLNIVLFAAWILTMISLPIARYAWGEPALVGGVILCVVWQAALVLHILCQAWGFWPTARLAAGVALFTWLVETIGTATGLPFGTYQYSDLLQPQVAHVPLLIPLAWLMMLPPAWAVAYRAAGGRYGLRFVALGALALTAWDLFLDPQMVAWGFWRWTEPGGYFGIPWSNYLGWLLTSALVTILVRPRRIPVRPLLLIYVITWLLETTGQLFFWDLPGPALIGFIGMGSLIWLAGLAPRRHKS